MAKKSKRIGPTFAMNLKGKTPGGALSLVPPGLSLPAGDSLLFTGARIAQHGREGPRQG